jgi:Rrf2 family iron-sulfur cluster assembly transcriptional regulator
MVDLAIHDNEEPVARRDIAERQGISADYVAQLFRPLQDAGLVEGVKGPGGGYRLTRQADRIRVRDVVEAVEGPLALAPCVEECDEPPCPQESHCPTRRVWERLSRRMIEVLEAYTLADLSASTPSPGVA